MKFKDKVGWEKGLAQNQDSYGNQIYRFAKSWADLMEARIANGKTVEQCAKDTSHEADTTGITGFMYGAAVSVLSAVWEHGEELRQWHNSDTQVGNEGDKANESGGVLNPAIMEIDI